MKIRSILPLLIVGLVTGSASALSTAPLEQVQSTATGIRDLTVTQIGEIVVLRGTAEEPVAVEAVEKRLRELGYERIVNAIELEQAPTDDQIRSSVEREIYMTPTLASSGIRVGTSNGTVTLEGFCSTLAQISQADRIARSVRGVRDVKTNLTVQPD